MAYASRTGTRRNLDALRSAGWGLLISATGVHRDEGFDRICLDNGAWTAFQRQEPWQDEPFRRLVETFGARADWVAAPDIVAGGRDSLLLSAEWICWLLERCPRVLIPVQDGMTPEDLDPYIRHDRRVGLFVGGSTEWKWNSLPEWSHLARRHGSWLHVARVNSAQRIRECARAGAHSFDGTSVTRFAITLPRLDAARRQGAFQC